MSAQPSTRLLTLVVASALFMESLVSTVIATSLAAIAADSGPRSAPLQPSISTGTRACAAATSGAIAAGASVSTITRSTHDALATRSTVRVSTGRPPNSLSR